jgi:hypothetical protein
MMLCAPSTKPHALPQLPSKALRHPLHLTAKKGFTRAHNKYRVNGLNSDCATSSTDLMLSPALCIRHPSGFRMPAGINGPGRCERTQKDKQSSLLPTRQAAGQATAVPASHAANPEPSCRSLSPAPSMPEPLAKSLKPSRRPSHSRTSKPRLLILAQTIMHARCRRQGRPCHPLRPPRPPMSARCRAALAVVVPPLPPWRPLRLIPRPTCLEAWTLSKRK